MTSKQEKRQQEALRAALDRLLQDPANKFCADCASSGPRWASPKLGVFICMKCAGIHRGLGVHISFVRSVTLDKWKESEVEDMNPGNSKSSAIYEATLPDNFPRPCADGVALEKFIRNKYVYKRYMLPNGEAKPAATKRSAPSQTDARPPTQPTSVTQQAKLAPQSAPPRPAPSNNGALDIFSFPTQPTQQPAPIQPAVAQSNLVQAPAPAQPAISQQEAAKNDIMSLFQTQPTFPQQPQFHMQPQFQQAQYPQQYTPQQQYAPQYQMPQAQQMAYMNFYQQQPQWPAPAQQQDTSGLEILSKIQSISQENRQPGQVYF